MTRESPAFRSIRCTSFALEAPLMVEYLGGAAQSVRYFASLDKSESMVACHHIRSSASSREATTSQRRRNLQVEKEALPAQQVDGVRLSFVLSYTNSAKARYSTSSGYICKLANDPGTARNRAVHPQLLLESLRVWRTSIAYHQYLAGWMESNIQRPRGRYRLLAKHYILRLHLTLSLF